MHPAVPAVASAATPAGAPTDLPTDLFPRASASPPPANQASAQSARTSPAPTLPPPAPIRQLHHFAYKARDAEETRRFYEDVLGLPLYHLIQSDHVPSTGEYCPYTHFFFRLQDGSFIAFFDLGDGEAALPSPNTPRWVNHIAFRVDSVQALLDTKARLEAHGTEVLGVTDHRIFQSIYFFDPNGIRLELTAQLADEAHMQRESGSARAGLDAWTAAKAARRAARTSASGSSAQPADPAGAA